MVNSVRRSIVPVVAGIAGLLAFAGSAQAAVTCTFDDAADTLAINMSADNEQAIVRVNAGTIEVVTAPAPCTNGNATVTTIDTVNVFDNSAGGDTRFEVRDVGAFAPGVTIEGTTAASEIEFNVALATGTTDEIEVEGSAASEVWRFGNAGLNANVGIGTDDLEVTPVGQPDRWELVGEGDVDNISGQGGNGAGTAFTGAARLTIFGGDGGDVIRGGDSATGDQLDGLGGDDTVLGFAGDDTVGGAPGTNSLDGGPGTDTGSFTNGNGATVDLGITGPQDTGGARGDADRHREPARLRQCRHADRRRGPEPDRRPRQPRPARRPRWRRRDRGLSRRRDGSPTRRRPRVSPRT